jgi:hypothetical protein
MKLNANAIPEGTFLWDFMEHMKDQETAEEFDLWSGLWALACAVGRRTVVPRPRAPVYLNMYLALIAESGIVRKSSAIRAASGLVRAMLLDDDDIMFFDAKTTPEQLDRLLHTNTERVGCGQVAISISELATFMGNESYTAGMPALLTDLYDCPDHRSGPGTIKDGPIDQHNLWVSFIAGSTPTWLLRTVNPAVSEGGFASRCLFVNATKPKRTIAWPTPPNKEHEGRKKAAMLMQLREIREESFHHHGVGLYDSAMTMFVDWYDRRTPSLDPFIATFEAREDAHVLRTAALLAINAGAWEIHVTHLVAALQLVNQVKKGAAYVFSHAVDRSRYGFAIELIRTVLMTRGMDPIPRGMLFRRMSKHLDHTEFVAMLDVLHECGAIQRFVLKQDGGPGRPTDYIRGTKGLMAAGLAEVVVKQLS